MTPQRVFEWRRWQVVGAFLVIVLIAIVISAWNDHRIDQAEDRITRNAARAADLAVTNKRQDEIRASLLQVLQQADVQACRRIEKLKTQNRIEAQRSFDRLSQTLQIIGIEQTPQVVQLAAQELARDLRRNAAERCERS